MNKYRNVVSVYNGSIFDSKSEVSYCIYLDSLIRSRTIKGYDRQVKIPIIVNNSKICDYVMDFVVHHPTYDELVEVKGYETTTYRLKKKLLEATYLKSNPITKFTIVKV